MSDSNLEHEFPSTLYLVVCAALLAVCTLAAISTLVCLQLAETPPLLGGASLIAYAILIGGLGRRLRYALLERAIDPEFRSGAPRSAGIPAVGYLFAMCVGTMLTIGGLFLEASLGFKDGPPGHWANLLFITVPGPVLLSVEAVDWLSQRVRKRALERTLWALLAVTLILGTALDFKHGVFPYPVINHLVGASVIALQVFAPRWTAEGCTALFADIGCRIGIADFLRSRGRGDWADAMREARVYFEPVD